MPATLISRLATLLRNVLHEAMHAFRHGDAASPGLAPVRVKVASRRRPMPGRR